MPVDKDGNITTTQSVNVETLHEFKRDNNKDVIALFDGGMARTPKDTGTGVELGGGAGPAYTLPAATPTVLGGVKQAAKVADAAGEAPTKAEYNALLAALRTAGILAK